MSQLGDLVISLAGDIAKFTEAMTRAEVIAGNTAKKIDGAMATAEKAVYGLAVGFLSFKTIDAFTSSIDGATQAAAELHKMAKNTASTAEELSRLKGVAKSSGTDLATVASGLVGLSKSMFDTASGTGKARDTFAALKLEVKDGNGQLKNTTDFMLELAQKLEGVGNKTQVLAMAQKAMKGSGSELVGFMKELAEAGLAEAKVTNQQAAEAFAYQRTLRQLDGAKKALSNTISQQVTPVMDAFARMLLQVRTQAGGLNDTVKHMAEENQIRQWAIDAGVGMAMVLDGFRNIWFGIKTVGEAVMVVAVFFIESFKNIGTGLGVLVAEFVDFGKLLMGIALIMAGQWQAGAVVLKDAMNGIQSGLDVMGARFESSFTNIKTAAGTFFDSFDERANNFGANSFVEKFLKQLEGMGAGLKKVGKEATGTTDIIKKFEKDAISSLTLSLAKDIAALQVNFESMRKFGVETKATASAEMALQLASMSASGALAEHARKTGESEAATRKRMMGMAELKDELTIMIQVEREYISTMEANRKAMGASVQAIVDQIEQQKQANAVYGLGVDAATNYAIGLLQAKLAAAELMEGSEDLVKSLELQIEKLQVLGKLQRSGEGARIMVDGWKNAAEEFGSLIRQMATDADGTLDYLENRFKQFFADLAAMMATKLVLQIAANLTGSGALMTAAAQIGQGTATGAISNWLTGASAANTGYGMLTGNSFGAVGSMYTGAANYLGFGASGSLSTANGMAGIMQLEGGGTIAGGTAPTSTALGPWAGAAIYAAIIAAAMMYNDHLFQSGWRQDGQDSRSDMYGGGFNHLTDNFFRGLGMSDRLASVLSGSSVTARLFGHGARHDDEYGVLGSFTGRGLDAVNYQDWSQRGGLFRSDIRRQGREGDLTPLDAEQKEFFDTFNEALRGTTDLLGALLNIDVSQVLADYAHDFQIAIKDRTPEQIAEAFSNLFGTVLQEQVESIFKAGGDDELAQYVHRLKGTGEEITRAIQELVGTMAALDAINLKGLDVHALMAYQQAGETLTQTLERVGGGWLKLKDAFTSDAVKFDRAKTDLRNLYNSLREFGYEVPTTREGWLSVMESIDQSTEAGRELFMRMMALAPAFDAVSSAAENMQASFVAFMSEHRPGYAAALAGRNLGNATSAFMAANTWTAGMSPDELVAALWTISDEDFARYSTEQQALILTILGLDSSLKGATKALDVVGNAIHSFNYAGAAAEAQNNANSWVGNLHNIFQGDFKDSQPAVIAAIRGRMANLQNLIDAPGAAQNVEQWTKWRNELFALQHLLDMSQADLNKFWEFEGVAPGHGKELLDLDKWYEESKLALEGNIPGLLALEEEFQRRRKEIMEGGITEALASAIANLRKWRDGLKINNELTTFTPMQQLDEARKQYEKLLALAQTGDVDAINQLAGAGDAYLKIAREIFASSSMYSVIFDKILSDTGLIIGEGSGPGAWGNLDDALPEGKLASSDDIKDVNDTLALVLAALQNGISTTDPATAAALDRLALTIERLASAKSSLLRA